MGTKKTVEATWRPSTYVNMRRIHPGQKKKKKKKKKRKKERKKDRKKERKKERKKKKKKKKKKKDGKMFRLDSNDFGFICTCVSNVVCKETSDLFELSVRN